MGSIPGSGRSPGGGNCNPLQYSCLENPMDKGTWQGKVHGVSKGLNTAGWLNNNCFFYQTPLNTLRGEVLCMPEVWVSLQGQVKLYHISEDPPCERSLSTGTVGDFLEINPLSANTLAEASLVAQLVKNLPAMQVIWVLSLGWEDPLEKGKATHSIILTWRSPWTV